MKISMDKYKTSELGRALKKVFRREMTVDESVALAKNEISAMMERAPMPPETDIDYGFMGDDVGECPLCHSRVRRTTFGYGCTGYKEGCKFTANFTICHRVISKANMERLLSEGRTAKIQGFISKTGKPFDAVLVLDSDGKIKFDFNQN